MEILACSEGLEPLFQVSTEVCFCIFDILLVVASVFSFRGRMGMMLCHICQFDLNPLLFSEEQSFVA